MPDVSIFNLDGQNISIKDSTARSAASAAQSAASTAQETANSASNKASSAQSAAENAAAAAQTAQKAAEQAKAAAEAAQSEINEIASMSRLEISYNKSAESITFTTSNHEQS